MAGYTVNNAFRTKRQNTATLRIYNIVASAIQEVPPLPKEVIVYRGVLNPNYKMYKPGDIIEETGFISTSFNYKVAREYAKVDGIIYKIHVPAGVKCLFISNNFGHPAFPDDDKDYDTCELLLPLNPVYKVIQMPDLNHVELRLIKFNTPTTNDILKDINKYDNIRIRSIEEFYHKYGPYSIIKDNSLISVDHNNNVLNEIATNSSNIVVVNVPKIEDDNLKQMIVNRSISDLNVDGKSYKLMYI